MLNEETYRELLPARLRELRKSKGYTYRKVAKIMGKKFKAYAAHEGGKSVPSILEMHALRKLYGFESIEQMLGFLEVKSS